MRHCPSLGTKSTTYVYPSHVSSKLERLSSTWRAALAAGLLSEVEECARRGMVWSDYDGLAFARLALGTAWAPEGRLTQQFKRNVSASALLAAPGLSAAGRAAAAIAHMLPADPRQDAAAPPPRSPNAGSRLP